MSFFCAILSFCDMVDFSNDCVHNFQVFLPTKYGQKLCLSQKMRNDRIGVFVILRFFLCDSKFLSFGRFVFNSG